MGPRKSHFEQRHDAEAMNIPMGFVSTPNAPLIPFCSFQAPLQKPDKLFSSEGRYRSEDVEPPEVLLVLASDEVSEGDLHLKRDMEMEREDLPDSEDCRSVGVDVELEWLLLLLDTVLVNCAEELRKTFSVSADTAEGGIFVSEVGGRGVLLL